MQDLVDRANRVMFDHVEQRDRLVQYLQISDAYTPVVMRILADIDEQNESDLFVIFASDFEDPDQYANELAQQLHDDWQRFTTVLANNDRDAPEKPDFGALDDAAAKPFVRLRDGFAAMRALLPNEPGHVLVFAFMPVKIADEGAFAETIREFIGNGPYEPLFRGTRVIVRIPDPSADAWSAASSNAWSQLEHLDFSQPAIEQNAKNIVDDDSQPMETRIQALLSDAIYDYGFGRADEARHKLDLVLGHYQSTENHAMQATVMNILGDLHRHRMDDLEKAEYWYECATVPAIEAKAPVILLTPTRNLGELAMDRNDAKSAEQWFGHAETLARHVPDPFSTIDLLELRGKARERMGDVDGALECWEGAVTLGKNLDYEGIEDRFGEHFRRVNA